MFRLMYLTFFKSFRGSEEQKHHLHESPALITFPLIILAVLATIGGLISLPTGSWLNEYLAPLFANASEEHHGLTSEAYMLMGIATAGAILGITIAYFKYIKQSQLPEEDAQITGLTKVVYNKYYVDEIYEAVIVKPVNALARFFRDYLETGLSALVFGFGKVALELGYYGRKLHNGSVGLYLFAFVLGVCAIVSYLFLAQ